MTASIILRTPVTCRESSLVQDGTIKGPAMAAFFFLGGGGFTAHKRSLGQGNMFTGVCLSTVGGAWSQGGGAWSQGEVHGPGGAWSQGVHGPGGCLVETPVPGWLLLQAVCILLECILAFLVCLFVFAFFAATIGVIHTILSNYSSGIM